VVKLQNESSNFDVKIYHGFSEELLDSMCDLENRIFDEPYSREKLKRKCSTKPGLIGLIAFKDGQPAAFKVGYEMSERLYYSWLGGVAPEYRRQGLARQLMELQHKVVTEAGYKTVRTHTFNKFREMLILNIRCGFNIVGVINDSADKELTIVLDKSLETR